MRRWRGLNFAHVPAMTDPERAPRGMNEKDTAPITESPAAEQKAESVDKAQDAAVEMARPGMLSTVRGFGSLLWGTVMAFFSDDCSSMAAALSFYTFFSLPALLTLLLTIIGRVADPATIQRAIVRQVGGLIGN